MKQHMINLISSTEELDIQVANQDSFLNSL